MGGIEMKQVLLLDGKEFDVHNSTIENNKITSVHFMNEKGFLSFLYDTEHKLNGYPYVDDLDSKIIDKDDFKTQLVQAIEEFLSDEEKSLDLENNDVADALVDASTEDGRGNYLNKCALRRQEQLGKVDGIVDVLNLVKLMKG